MLNPEITYTITQAQLADAIQRWEDEAAKGNWPTRTDDQRYLDSANYLLVFIQTGIWPSDA